MDVKKDERICRDCKYHRIDSEGEWVCRCVDSDLCGIRTEWNMVVGSLTTDDSTRIKS